MQSLDKTIALVISWFNQAPERKRVAAARRRHARSDEQQAREFVALVADEVEENGVGRNDPRFTAIVACVVFKKLQKAMPREPEFESFIDGGWPEGW